MLIYRLTTNIFCIAHSLFGFNNGIMKMPKHQLFTFLFAHICFSKSLLIKNYLFSQVTRPFRGEKQSSSGNLVISPGVGRLWNFSGEYDMFLGHCRQKVKNDIFARLSPKNIGIIFQTRTSSYTVLLKQHLWELWLPVIIRLCKSQVVGVCE